MRKFHQKALTLCCCAVLAAQLGLSVCAAASFNAEYYAKTYPEIAEACGYDEGAMILDYLEHGMAEKRKASAWARRGDTLKLTDEQIALIWTPVPIDELANYKSLKRKMTDEEFAEAYAEALKIVTPLAFKSRKEQLEGIKTALRERFETGGAYSMSSAHYNDPYGYLVQGVASCAGCARATGLCLNILGILYEHVNENQYSHQWCRVEVDGSYWICDAFGLYCGEEPAPYEHPYC